MPEATSKTMRQQIEDALQELDCEQKRFEAEIEKAEAEFASNMAKGRAEFQAGVEKARTDLQQALHDLG